MLNDEIDTKANKILLLHSRADRALRSLIAENLEEYRITMMEWLLMGIVAEGPEGGLSMSTIAQELDVTLPQVTALITNLTKKRLIKLKTQRRDRRSRHALLTAKGKVVLEQVNRTVENAMASWPAELPDSQLSGYLATVKVMAYQSPQLPN